MQQLNKFLVRRIVEVMYEDFKVLIPVDYIRIKMKCSNLVSESDSENPWFLNTTMNVDYLDLKIDLNKKFHFSVIKYTAGQLLTCEEVMRQYELKAILINNFTFDVPCKIAGGKNICQTVSTLTTSDGGNILNINFNINADKESVLTR